MRGVDIAGMLKGGSTQSGESSKMFEQVVKTLQLWGWNKGYAAHAEAAASSLSKGFLLTSGASQQDNSQKRRSSTELGRVRQDVHCGDLISPLVPFSEAPGFRSRLRRRLFLNTRISPRRSVFYSACCLLLRFSIANHGCPKCRKRPARHEVGPQSSSPSAVPRFGMLIDTSSSSSPTSTAPSHCRTAMTFSLIPLAMAERSVGR